MSSTRPELSFSDKGEEAGFLSFLKSLGSKEEGTVRIFERADYYSAHGEDAIFVAQTVYHTNSVLKYLGNSDPSRGVASCTLSAAVFSNFLSDVLLNLGLRVEIYGNKGRNSWKVIKQASPGNFQQVEDLLSNQIDQNPVVASIKISATIDQKTVGLCFVDASAGEIGVSQFVDNDGFSNMESMIIQLGVKECVIASDDSGKDVDLATVKQVVSRCNIPLTERRPGDFNSRDIEQDLSRLLPGDLAVAQLPQLSMTVAMAAAGAVIKYLGLMTAPQDFGRYKLHQHSLGQYMRLDAAAVTALNLMPGPRDGSRSNANLFGLLNKCKTAAGTRLLIQWLKQPLMDLAEIENRQSLVHVFSDEDPGIRQTIQQDHLAAIPDIPRMIRKFHRGVAKLEDVVRLYQVVIRLPLLIEAMESNSALETAYVNELRQHSTNLHNFQELVETTVDLQALDSHEFVINPDFDDRLKQIRQRLDILKEDIHKEHQNVGDDLSMEPEKKLKLENHRVYGWCLRLSRADASCLRTRSGYFELSTQKAGVYFLSSKLKAANEEYNDLNTEYTRTQTELVNEVVSIASTYSGVLENLSSILAHLDVIVSFAHVASYAPVPYVRPKLHPRGTGSTVLVQARHPCMESQDDVTFIANDVTLVKDSSQFLIITGPNMGGKSTYIRQVGVIALLAQIGSFVPCESAELTIFDSILARVGAGDSQLKGVSTFMAEMLETATILKSATSESLIIIDELGRGTSTYDGFGLAWAISEHIVDKIGCFCLFATHFHELTTLSEKHPGVENLHVVAHVEAAQESRDITLLYKVEKGVSDRSFGINVAQVVQFPEKVVKMAKRKAEELEEFEGDDDDAVCKKATTKFSKQQIQQGGDLLKTILKEWADGVSEDASGPEMLTKLRNLAEGYHEKIEATPFLRDLVEAL